MGTQSRLLKIHPKERSLLTLSCICYLTWFHENLPYRSSGMFFIDLNKNIIFDLRGFSHAQTVGRKEVLRSIFLYRSSKNRSFDWARPVCQKEKSPSKKFFSFWPTRRCKDSLSKFAQLLIMGMYGVARANFDLWTVNLSFLRAGSSIVRLNSHSKVISERCIG